MGHDRTFVVGENMGKSVAQLTFVLVRENVQKLKACIEKF